MRSPPSPGSAGAAPGFAGHGSCKRVRSRATTALVRLTCRFPSLAPSIRERSQRWANDRHFPFQDLDVYRAARELAARVHRAAIRDAELRDQATRAAKSAFLNLCEGLPDDRPAMRRKYFVQADGSLHETVGAVDLAAAIGALDAARAEEILAVAGRMRGMLRGLLRSSGRGA